MQGSDGQEMGQLPEKQNGEERPAFAGRGLIPPARAAPAPIPAHLMACLRVHVDMASFLFESRPGILCPPGSAIVKPDGPQNCPTASRPAP